MASILLVVKHWEQEQHILERNRRIVFETSADTTVIGGATAGGDERKLRGIPAIGRGVTGAIAGTVPHSVR
jgi:hypothetical protein